MYLPVSILGYLCDRAGPAPLSLLSAILFGSGYLLAAFTYRSGRDEVTGYTNHRGWPVGIMILSFAIIGVATVSMYLSAVTSVAKNFGRGKYRGMALACPIAAFGLSGMWQSQVGTRLLYERLPDGEKGDVDVFRFFVFLSLLLSAVGIIGTAFLKVVDEDALIDEAVSELERSGLLEDSAVLRASYGSIANHGVDERHGGAKAGPSKKSLLLNAETQRYLKDHTMYLTALGFLFVSGPGEAFIANLGTVIGTLSPPSEPMATSPATHVSIVAISSTIARLLAGSLTDLLAPTPNAAHLQPISPVSLTFPTSRRKFSLPRPAILIFSAMLLSAGEVLLASGYCQDKPSRFWLVSLLHGFGYGAIFSLTPLIVTVIWGVENFGTNWGIVAMMPAFGNAGWGLVYSWVYEHGRRPINPALHRATDPTTFEAFATHQATASPICYGKACYESSFWAMAVSVWIGCILWFMAWRGKNGWKSRGIAV